MSRTMKMWDMKMWYRKTRHNNAEVENVKKQMREIQKSGDCMNTSDRKSWDTVSSWDSIFTVLVLRVIVLVSVSTVTVSVLLVSRHQDSSRHLTSKQMHHFKTKTKTVKMLSQDVTAVMGNHLTLISFSANVIISFCLVAVCQPAIKSWLIDSQTASASRV